MIHSNYLFNDWLVIFLRVESWAGKLGDELWELGTTVTKSPEIRTVSLV